MNTVECSVCKRLFEPEFPSETSTTICTVCVELHHRQLLKQDSEPHASLEDLTQARLAEENLVRRLVAEMNWEELANHYRELCRLAEVYRARAIRHAQLKREYEATHNLKSWADAVDKSTEKKPATQVSKKVSKYLTLEERRKQNAQKLFEEFKQSFLKRGFSEEEATKRASAMVEL